MCLIDPVYCRYVIPILISDIPHNVNICLTCMNIFDMAHVRSSVPTKQYTSIN